MPMDRSKYPKDWAQISRRIRFERAKGKCEWCGVAHGHFRNELGQSFETMKEFWAMWGKRTKMPVVRVVLTTAHLGVDKPDGSPGDKRDTMDCRDENLAALCQRCHLGFDRDDHIRSRRTNRRMRLVAAGQLEMFGSGNIVNGDASGGIVTFEEGAR